MPDYRFTGELRAHEEVWLVHGILWGRPVVAMAARDIRAAARASRSLLQSTGQGVTVVALEATGVPALLAAALDKTEDIAAVVCQCIGPTYRSGNLAYPEGETSQVPTRRSRPDALAHSLPPVVPNILKVGDLPELVACALPRRVVLGDAQDAQAYAGLERFGVKLSPEPLTQAEIVAAVRD
ncbi:MAG: hypothetical protein H5T86_10870 [Armatimonadetes bacterium]|nr:hypothetical protein [Armatimonadota bacterium]